MAGVVAAGILAMQAEALAQEKLRPNERYCLEAFSGGRLGGIPHPLLCRFTTMEQCIASMTGPRDRCMLNPRSSNRG
jgi:hypothetical protein